MTDMTEEQIEALAREHVELSDKILAAIDGQRMDKVMTCLAYVVAECAHQCSMSPPAALARFMAECVHHCKDMEERGHGETVQ